MEMAIFATPKLVCYLDQKAGHLTKKVAGKQRMYGFYQNEEPSPKLM
jgi:hypothetical protein